jgi:hypothetical protein
MEPPFLCREIHSGVTKIVHPPPRAENATLSIGTARMPAKASGPVVQGAGCPTTRLETEMRLSKSQSAALLASNANWLISATRLNVDGPNSREANRLS